MEWYWWVLISLLEIACVYIAYKIGKVNGKFQGKFKWRCPECKAMVFADGPEEILYASVDHMKGHLNGAVPSSEEGSK